MVTLAEQQAIAIKEVNDKWDSVVSPWVNGYYERDNESRLRSWQLAQYTGRKNELEQVTMKYAKLEGFVPTSIRRGGAAPMPTHPTAIKLFTGEAINQVSVSHLQNNTPLDQISNKTTRYEVAITRANDNVAKGGSLLAHSIEVQNAKDVYDMLSEFEIAQRSADARRESANQSSADANYWDSVINNPITRTADHEAHIELSKELEVVRLAEIEEKRVADSELKRVEDNELKKLELIELKKIQDNMLINLEVVGLSDIESKKLQQIKDQEVTFNEQTNSGDYNETPITDINLNNGCSECTEPKHKMPDGSLMKDSDMEKGNYMKFAGIAAAGIIGLLLYSKGSFK